MEGGVHTDPMEEAHDCQMKELHYWPVVGRKQDLHEALEEVHLEGAQEDVEVEQY